MQLIDPNFNKYALMSSYYAMGTEKDISEYGSTNINEQYEAQKERNNSSFIEDYSVISYPVLNLKKCF